METERRCGKHSENVEATLLEPMGKVANYEGETETFPIYEKSHNDNHY